MYKTCKKKTFLKIHFSFKNNRLPQTWKISTIFMLGKNADFFHLTKSFKSISSTSAICKLNEKIIQRRIISNLESNNLINRVQTGFRRHRQIRDNIFFLVAQKALKHSTRTTKTKSENNEPKNIIIKRRNSKSQ